MDIPQRRLGEKINGAKTPWITHRQLHLVNMEVHLYICYYLGNQEIKVTVKEQIMALFDT